jgi:glycosyltransferase involved in cell wall biosynthesis
LILVMNTNDNAICPDNQQKRDTVIALIFSKDRTMQLQATIESLFLHCRDTNTLDVVALFNASEDLHQREYNELKIKFPAVKFVEETDFRQQVLSLLANCRYVLFLVDDNIFVKSFSIRDAVAALNSQKNALGFSLRLGTNTVFCYTLNSRQSPPAFEIAGQRILKYHWPGAECDFGYPLELSSSLYRSNEILQLLSRLEFPNPNILENQMCGNKDAFASSLPFLLTFEQSVTFCNPVNVVQRVYKNNRFGTVHNYTTEQLAAYFSRGMTIDIQKYAGFIPNAAHQEVELYFKSPPLGTAFNPKFSIVMANYNNSKYIGQAIKSVLGQTFNDWQLIIVDDCSTDNSVDIINSCLADSRIRLLRHAINMGYTAALKTAIAAVGSNFFAVLDSDDCLTAKAIETMYYHHVSSPDCGLIYSQFVYCDENLTPGRLGFCAHIPSGQTTLDLNAVSHFKTFKLSDYLKTSGYDENILYAEDVDIIYKMEEVAGLKFVDKCLYLYRELPDSICHSKSKINIAIMSRVKARINAIKRRCAAMAASNNKNFEDLFAQAVEQARITHKDVDQYLIILSKLYENNLLSDSIIIPDVVKADGDERILLWLAANVNVKFDELFGLLKRTIPVDNLPARPQQPMNVNAGF